MTHKCVLNLHEVITINFTVFVHLGEKFVFINVGFMKGRASRSTQQRGSITKLGSLPFLLTSSLGFFRQQMASGILPIRHFTCQAFHPSGFLQLTHYMQLIK